MPNYSSWTHSKLRCVVFIQVCTMYICVGPLKYIDKQEKKTDTLGIYANVSLNVTERRVATVNVYTCTKKDCSAEWFRNFFTWLMPKKNSAKLSE